MTASVNRRGFLKAGAATAGGLLVSFYLPEQSKAAAATTSAKLNAFVQVSTDDTVTLFIHKAEMGQDPHGIPRREYRVWAVPGRVR
jgi:isoquinoline 1-oxidoreductase subunit beta